MPIVRIGDAVEVVHTDTGSPGLAQSVSSDNNV